MVETVREVCADPQIGKNVKAISLSLQGGTFAPVDENCQSIRPAIVWNDTRCDAQRQAFLEEVGDTSVMYSKTGWNLGRAMLANEIRWMRENEPENFVKTAWFLSVPDYISMKMTGIAAIDMSDMGINQLGDIRTGKYDPELLKFAGVTEDKLPKILRSGEAIGNLTAEAAAQLGPPTVFWWQAPMTNTLSPWAQAQSTAAISSSAPAPAGWSPPSVMSLPLRRALPSPWRQSPANGAACFPCPPAVCAWSGGGRT